MVPVLWHFGTICDFASVGLCGQNIPRPDSLADEKSELNVQWLGGLQGFLALAKQFQPDRQQHEVRRSPRFPLLHN